MSSGTEYPAQDRATYERWLETHLTNFEVLSVTADTATTYAGLRIALRKAGTPIPANDAWIAVLAVEHGLPVLSRDAHFDVVAGLRRVDWQD